MRYAIDVVFLDRAGNIRKIVTRLKPWHMASCPGSWQALELVAGEAVRLKLEIGLPLFLKLSNSNQENSS
jgi:uncharacterized membrane protein (UPF0127 family)